MNTLPITLEQIGYWNATVYGVLLPLVAGWLAAQYMYGMLMWRRAVKMCHRAREHEDGDTQQ